MTRLPPGPRQPAAVQTARWLTRHIPLLEGCRRRVLRETRRPLSQVIGIVTRPLGRFGPYAPFQRLLDRTDAVAAEAQRLRPVITSVGRTLGAPGAYGGHELPEGASVMVSTYLLHSRPDLHPEPYAFRPERFVGSRAQPYSLLPFGGGVRRCIGAAFANLELRVVLREVLRSVDLQAADPRAERPTLSGITLVPRRDVRVLAAPY